MRGVIGGLGAIGGASDLTALENPERNRTVFVIILRFLLRIVCLKFAKICY
jgi:hypothetical protein